MKFVIGSAQFGVQYGINNQTGIPSDFELSKLLQHASDAGINLIDTAAAYGSAEQRLGALASGHFEFISKFPAKIHAEQIPFFLQRSLDHLKIPYLYGYMAHDADDLIRDEQCWPILLEQKNIGKIKKIGFSLYTPQQLLSLLDKGYLPDLIQVPYSLLDRKFNEFFSVTRELNIEVHIRSVFLQGLYFRAPDQLPIRLMPMKNALERLHKISADNNLSIGTIALSYVVHNPDIHHVVIGLDSARQLHENLLSVAPYERIVDVMEEINSIHLEQPELLNPANW